MNELYGVDPAAPSDSEELNQLLDQFGPAQGRFILDVPGDWLGHARSVLTGLPPLARLRALETLTRSRRAVIRSDAGLARVEKTWLESSVSLAGRVDGMIGRRHCPPGMTPIHEVLEAPERLPTGYQAELPRQAEAYVGAAWPLLAQSPKVVLVDAQLQLRAHLPVDAPAVARYRRVLQGMLVEAVRRRCVVLFELHVLPSKALEADPRGHAFQKELETLARQAGASRIEMGHVALPQHKDVAHRGGYLLGAGCGLHFQRGFDTASDDSTNRVQWLDGPQLAPLLERFDLPDH